MRSFARLGAIVGATTLAVTGLVAAVPAAQAAPAKDPIGVDTGATWLAKQLTNGIVHNHQYDFDDYGLTIDVGLALHAVGGHASTVSSIANALATGAHDNYYTYFNGTNTTTSAGSLAKLALFVQQAGGTPTNYGGHNLITLLEGTVAPSSPIAGRIQDANPSPSDLANTLGQAYAARALATASSSKAASVLSFLLDQQCPNGGFRLSFNTDKTSSSQSCTNNNQAQIDATSVALLEMRGLSGTTTAVTGAENFLIGKQQSSGAWGGDPGGSAANSNATGLAAWALGNTAGSAKGAAWLRDHQATYYDYCTKLKNDVGGVAYDDAGLSAARSHGIDPTSATQDQVRRATAQALPGLQYLDADSTPAAPQLTGPSGYVKGGGTASFTVTGVHAGDQLCITGGPGGAGGTASGTTWTKAAKIANLTGTRTFAVRDRDGHSDTAEVKQLGSKTLRLTRAHYVNKRSSFATVTIYGLASGERASILFRGALKASGTADSTGRFTRSIWTGRKLGRGTVGGYGQFGDIRKGHTTLKVVR